MSANSLETQQAALHFTLSPDVQVTAPAAQLQTRPAANLVLPLHLSCSEHRQCLLAIGHIPSAAV
jgi:hypothetical protein